MNQIRQNVIIEGRPALTVARGLAWTAHCLMRKEATIEIWPGGPSMQLAPKAIAHGSTSIYMKRLGYEPHLKFLASMILPGMVILDIGANVGVYALTLAEATGPTGRVHAFEPGQISLASLRTNCQELNPALPVSIWPIALSDRAGTANLYHVGGASTTFSLGTEPRTDSEEVLVVTLDTWSAEHSPSTIDVIKIDVEGHEPGVFAGGYKTLLEHRPLILFESSRSALARNGFDAESCWRPLRDLGYEIYHLSNGALKPQEILDDGNFYAIHPESKFHKRSRPE